MKKKNTGAPIGAPAFYAEAGSFGKPANIDPFGAVDGGEELVGREADAVWRFSPAEACFEIKYIFAKAQEIGAGK